MEDKETQVPETEQPGQFEKWHAPLTRVTPLSRYLAMALFVLLPFMGFWLGVEYAGRETNTATEQPIDPTVSMSGTRDVRETVPLSMSSSTATSSVIWFPSSIVKSFFPQKLRDESEQDFISGGPEPSEFFNYAVGDLENTGRKDFIVAAYTNGFSGVIRVLRKRGDSFILADEPDLPLLGGIRPEVKLLNLDTEPRPEVIVSFSSAGGPSSDWVFRWYGNALSLVGPTVTDENGDISTILVYAEFVDLDGDGAMEIVNPSSLDGNQIYQVYKINGSQVKTLNFFATFVCYSEKPVTHTRTFSVAKADIPYLLHVVNGNGKKDSLVSNAVIKINGAIVAGPQQFSENKSGLVIPVSLLSNNTLNIDLQNKPGSQITVFIEPTASNTRYEGVPDSAP